MVRWNLANGGHPGDTMPRDDTPTQYLAAQTLRGHEVGGTLQTEIPAWQLLW